MLFEQFEKLSYLYKSTGVVKKERYMLYMANYFYCLCLHSVGQFAILCALLIFYKFNWHCKLFPYLLHKKVHKRPVRAGSYQLIICISGFHRSIFFIWKRKQLVITKLGKLMKSANLGLFAHQYMFSPSSIFVYKAFQSIIFIVSRF